MRYIFFGTPEFASIILERLIEAGMPPALVVTNPDKPTGRKQIMTSPSVKVVAEKFSIPLIQPESLKTRNTAWSGALGEKGLKPLPYGISILRGNNLSSKLSTAPFSALWGEKWDLFVVAAYGKLIPKEVLEVPRLGAINIHPSLLPKYRGPTPIQTAILNGDAVTGVSIMRLDEEIDHGPVLARREYTMTNDDDYDTLARRLAELGAEMLIETLPKYVAGKITLVPQDHAKATFTKKFTTADAEIAIQDLRAALRGDTEKSERIDRMVRALNPEPGTWVQTDDNLPPQRDPACGGTSLNLPKNKRVKILKASLKGGTLKLTRVQVEGKEPRNL